MWKNLAWNIFKITGNLEIYMLYKNNEMANSSK